MRSISPEFAVRLAAPTTTLCACWRFVRRDGRVFGATDHDRPIAFEDVTYYPAHGLAGAELTQSDGLAPGRAFASGALEAAFITEGDLSAGLWDGARVEVWRVDWAEPQHRVRVWSGRLSEVSREGAAFRAELVSAKADLERTIGRTYARMCDAELGDSRCGVDLGSPSRWAEGEVLPGIGSQTVRFSGLAGFVDGWFTAGVLVWVDGVRAGLSARILEHAGETLTLSGPMGAVGDRFVATAGCDKSFAMCRERFGNRERFRGFPHLPGPDFVLSGPAAGAAGGRRG